MISSQQPSSLDSISFLQGHFFEVEIICGVYLLLDQGKVVYVGQSKNIHGRIASHKDKKFERAVFITCSLDDLDCLESALIGVFKPEKNMDGEKKRFVVNDKNAFMKPALVLEQVLGLNCFPLEDFGLAENAADSKPAAIKSRPLTPKKWLHCKLYYYKSLGRFRLIYDKGNKRCCKTFKTHKAAVQWAESKIETHF